MTTAEYIEELQARYRRQMAKGEYQKANTTKLLISLERANSKSEENK